MGRELVVRGDDANLVGRRGIERTTTRRGGKRGREDRARGGAASTKKQEHPEKVPRRLSVAQEGKGIVTKKRGGGEGASLEEEFVIFEKGKKGG